MMAGGAGLQAHDGRFRSGSSGREAFDSGPARRAGHDRECTCNLGADTRLQDVLGAAAFVGLVRLPVAAAEGLVERGAGYC